MFHIRKINVSSIVRVTCEGGDRVAQEGIAHERTGQEGIAHERTVTD